VAALPQIDAIVHAAGFMRTAVLGELKPEDGEGMWRIHVEAAAVLANALMPKLPDGARIVLIGSRTAAGALGRSQYAATKAALVGMARSWAVELAMLFKRLYQSHLRAVAGALLLGASVLASAQGYPSKAVKVIIPFPLGGPTDTVGRMLAQKLSKETGQSFIVENRPGGQGVIGGDAVAKSTADGYTLLFSASTFTTTPMTLKSSPYDVVKDFTPIALLGKGPLAVSVNKKLPIRNIKELISYAQAHPGKMSFAIGSQTSAGHLSTELLKRAGKIDYLVVPYKGSAPAYQDLIGGAIDGFIDPVLGVMSYHKSGMVRVVAVTSRDRLPSPDVPTVAETVPGYEFYS
jgi:tripartite-type tricarboxylate transporter receptor subunit TctC